jgi:hypothetical protein
MWRKIGIKTTKMPTKLGVNSKHKLFWNIASSYGLNTQYFMLSSFKQMTPLSKDVHDD